MFSIDTGVEKDVFKFNIGMNVWRGRSLICFILVLVVFFINITSLKIQDFISDPYIEIEKNLYYFFVKRKMRK